MRTLNIRPTRRGGTRPKPAVVVSKCLLAERCRYDGRRIAAPAVRSLRSLIEAVPVCPETGIGLSTPRDPIRLVRTRRGIRLVQTGTGRDLTARMRSFRRRFVTGIKVDGFILKARSPSCAVRDAAVHDDQGETMEETRPGLFAAEILVRFPGLPVEDEERLEVPSVMLQFVARLFDIRPHRPKPERRRPGP